MGSIHKCVVLLLYSSAPNESWPSHAGAASHAGTATLYSAPNESWPSHVRGYLLPTLLPSAPNESWPSHAGAASKGYY